MMKPPETEPEEAAVVLSLRHRPSEAVSLNIPLNTLGDIRQVAAERDMSEAALLKFYIGQVLRQDLPRRPPSA